MIKPGDIVTVTDWSKIHPSSYRWMHDHRAEIGVDLLIRYASGMKVYDTVIQRQDFKVVYVDEENSVALIEIVVAGPRPIVFLIDIDAVEKRRPRFTKAEVEKLLGYQFDLID